MGSFVENDIRIMEITLRWDGQILVRVESVTADGSIVRSLTFDIASQLPAGALTSLSNFQTKIEERVRLIMEVPISPPPSP